MHRSAADQAALAALSADGEPALGAIQLPQYLSAAAAVLVVPLGLQVLHASADRVPQAQGLQLRAPVTAVGACPGDSKLQVRSDLCVSTVQLPLSVNYTHYG